MTQPASPSGQPSFDGETAVVDEYEQWRRRERIKRAFGVALAVLFVVGLVVGVAVALRNVPQDFEKEAENAINYNLNKHR